MSWWDDFKKPLYAQTKWDSRIAERFGNALGWDGLENEGKRNQKNPGHAIGKAAQIWATMALGDIGSGAGAAGGAAANAAAPASSALAEEGMFAMSETAKQQLAEQAMRAAAEKAAQEAAQQSSMQAASQGGGMFGQIPGVTSGTAQDSMLRAQTGMFGGQGADMTAQSAMPAVKDAYRSGQMGTMEYAGNVLKSDAAGMNDPRVWWDRLGKNASRMGGGNRGAQQLAMKSLMGQGQQQQQPQSNWRAPQGKLPEQARSEGGNDMQKLLADYKAGRINEQELRMRLQALGAMA